MRPRLSPVAAGVPQPRRLFKPVERPRISQLLDSAHAYSVTVLLAGAGYGKSVALDHWLARQTGTIVRYDVLEGSRGIFDFALGLATTLGPAMRLGTRAAANAVNAAEKSPTPDIDLAAWFANALRKFRGTIVIDDFHVAALDDPLVARLLARLVEGSGEHIRWVIASRASCGLPISSWIAYGQSQMALGERELSFTHDEAAAAGARSEAQFSSAQLNELYAYTGGWPTAIAFAMLGAAQTLDLEALRANTRELSYQYLAEQVLRSLSEADADFLLTTSVYDRLDVDVLTQAGIENPRARLQFLKEQGTFIVLDSSGGIRYHDLFRDFLRNELAKTDDTFRTAWQDAAQTYERLGQFGPALAAYEESGQRDEAIRVLEQQGFTLIEHGKRRDVQRALAACGEIDFHAHPAILALRGNCEANAGNTDRAETWYRLAIEHAASSVQRAELCLQFARELVQRNRLDGIDILEPVLDGDLPLALRVSIMGTLATYYWQAQRSREALELMESAVQQAARITDDEVIAVLLHQSAYLQLMTGNWEGATDRAMEALHVAKRLDLHGLCARIHSVLYYVNAAAENIPQALWWSRQMERAATDSGDMLLLFSSIMASYALEVERGNLDSLPRFSEQLRLFEGHQFARATTALLPTFALQAAWHRQFDEAVRLLLGTQTQQPSASRRALRAAEIALYAAAAGTRQEAQEFCRYAHDQLRLEDGLDPYLPSRHASTLVWIGLTELLLGKISTANRMLGEAEKLGHLLPNRSKALVRASRALFVHIETRALDEEVESALQTLEENSYAGIARMLRVLPLPKPERAGTTAVLTRTEIEVLRALERCGDSKAAAADLDKSPQTIDWHVKSIKKKLGVKSRRDAIMFARERGLIG